MYNRASGRSLDLESSRLGAGDVTTSLNFHPAACSVRTSDDRSDLAGLIAIPRRLVARKTVRSLPVEGRMLPRPASSGRASCS